MHSLARLGAQSGDIGLEVVMLGNVGGLCITGVYRCYMWDELAGRSGVTSMRFIVSSRRDLSCRSSWHHRSRAISCVDAAVCIAGWFAVAFGDRSLDTSSSGADMGRVAGCGLASRARRMLHARSVLM
ncbi:hypothetical protein Tco_1546090 [Tanacetum coccineum]